MTRIAAPAPIDEDEADAAPPSPAAQDEHALCEAWAQWSRTRGRYGPPTGIPPNLLGRLRAPTRATGGEGPDGVCSATLAALDRAIAAQPEGRSKQVFLLFYLHRARNIKALAARIGVSRQKLYESRDRARRRIVAAAHRIEACERENALALPHGPAVTPGG